MRARPAWSAAMRIAWVVPLALLAVAGAASSAPPADAFCVILIEALDGMQGVRVLVDEETTPEQRAALFPAIDTDGDGAVTRSEGDAWRRHNLRLHNGTDGLPAVQRVWLRPADADGDGAPLYVAATRQVGHTFHKQDHQQPWPVTESIDLETQALREFSYPVVEGAAVFELLGGDDGSAPATSTSTTTTAYGASATPEYVVVRAPEGWLVGRVQGRDYAGPIDTQPQAREVDLPAFDTKSPFTITFVRASSSSTDTSTVRHTITPTGTGTPSGGADDTLDIAGPGSAALALVCLALAARRRL